MSLKLAVRMFERVLAEEGLPWSVDVAESGEKAVDMARDFPYAFIVMDLVMPGIGGLKAIELILAADDANPSRQPRTPIVITSAHISVGECPTLSFPSVSSRYPLNSPPPPPCV